jgi:glycine betaine/choline ABC-type transport system substrate-binding protein
MKKIAKYDEEELDILQAWEAGSLKPVSDMAEQVKAHRAAADATFKKRPTAEHPYLKQRFKKFAGACS